MSEQIKQLRALARQCQNYQLERGWSDARMCKEIGSLGSTKTYKRILDEADDLEELNVVNQLHNYEAALELIKLTDDKDRLPEPTYKDFTNIKDSEAAVFRAMREETKSRFVVIQGENGTGKDEVLGQLQTRWAKITVAVEADEFWSESLATPTEALYNALCIRRKSDGESNQEFKLPRWPSERQKLIIEALNNHKLILLVNEAHHMGPRGLNFFKTLINHTPTVVVFLGIPKMLRRLMSTAFEEAEQLYGNRLCEVVYLPTPPVDEIIMMLDKRGVKFQDVKARQEAAKVLATDAPCFGNWAFVRNVTRELNALTKAKGPITTALFADAVTKVRSRRVRKNRPEGN